MVFYGVNNANLRMLRALFSKLRIVGRGSVLKVIGNPEDIAEFDVVYEAIYRHCVNYNKLTEEDIVTLIQGRSNEQLEQEARISKNLWMPIKRTICSFALVLPERVKRILRLL